MIDKILISILVIGIPIAILILIFLKLIDDSDNKSIEIVASIFAKIELILLLSFSVIGIFYFVKCLIWIVRTIWT